MDPPFPVGARVGKPRTDVEQHRNPRTGLTTLESMEMSAGRRATPSNTRSKCSTRSAMIMLRTLLLRPSSFSTSRWVPTST